MNIQTRIHELTEYAIEHGLIDEQDRRYAHNRLIETLGLSSYEEADTKASACRNLEEILADILDFAYENGLFSDNDITHRDLFDTKIMGLLTPPPSDVIRAFRTAYRISPEQATDWYYDFSQNTNYIRRDRIARDIQWKAETEYGQLDITINLSKPEKDPKANAAARKLPASNNHRCMLCK